MTYSLLWLPGNLQQTPNFLLLHWEFGPGFSAVSSTECRLKADTQGEQSLHPRPSFPQAMRLMTTLEMGQLDILVFLRLEVFCIWTQW